MRVSLNELKRLVDFPYSPEELADKLTNLGLEVREISSFGKFNKVVVGKIVDIKKHPNADRLNIVKVNVGEGTVSLVCGAPNVKEGYCVAVALEGAELPGGIKVKKTKIRGVFSPGMICSERELGLGEDHSGIMVLPSDLTPGSNLSHALGIEDVILDIEITSNRGDCLSILGIAREIAALTGSKVRIPSDKIKDNQIVKETDLLSIQIDNPELCPLYTARIIRDVKITSSPYWLWQKVLLSGARPINNVVDVTNYVMWEIGQPMHPFDLDRIEGKKIVVRQAREGEVLVTLDDKLRTLNKNMLVIASTHIPIALAGIMGGKNTQVQSSTCNVLLEAAYFDPICVGKTSRKLGLSTEASYRFERGIDPAMVEKALNRAAMLIQKVAGGKIVEPVLREGKEPSRKKVIYFRPSRVNRIIGNRISFSTIENILKNLEFEIDKNKSKWKVTVPTFRGDVEREIDLIEEVCRVYGYNEVGKSLPSLGSGGGKKCKEEKVKDEIRNLLKGCGFYEVVTNPLVGEKSKRISALNSEKMIPIRNPLSIQQRFLRAYLFPGLLEVASFNYNQEKRNLRIMEIGKTFIREDKKLKEILSLSAVVVEDNFDLFHLKGIVELILQQTKVDKVQFRAYPFPFLSPAESILVLEKELNIGFFGKLNVNFCEELKLPLNSYLFEINMDFIVSTYKEEKKYHPLPRFPSLKRDLSFVMREDIPAEEAKQYILNKARYVEKVDLIDVYQGANIPEGHKSITFSLIFRHPDRTLTDSEVNSIQDKIIKSMEEKWGAYLRKE